MTEELQYTNSYHPTLSAAALRANASHLQHRLKEVEAEAHAIRTALTAIRVHPNLHEGFVPAAEEARRRGPWPEQGAPLAQPEEAPEQPEKVA